jgi:hypothetical protein
MSRTSQLTSEPLAYATRAPDARVPRHYPLLAALFTAPAVAAAVALLNQLAGIHLLGPAGEAVAAWLWLIAIVSAIASCFYFAERFKPWYVWLCLVVNFTGLVFTMLPPGGIWFLHLVPAAFRGRTGFPPL